MRPPRALRTTLALLLAVALAGLPSTGAVGAPGGPGGPGAPGGPGGGGQRLAVVDLSVNGTTERTGHLADEPVLLSWQLDSARRGVLQSAYQVRVWEGDRPGGPALWDSGRISSDRSTDVPYDGPDLQADTDYTWSVRAWDGRRAPSAWSKPSGFETALAGPDAWSADWIGKNTDVNGPQWTDYTVSVSASDISGALGVYLRGDADDAYMWQLSESEGSLRPHTKVGGAFTVLDATPFAEGFDLAARHDYEFQVSGDTITTSVDGEVLDTRTDQTLPGPGLVGLRTNGAETGTVHAMSVVNADGETLLDATFPADENPFSAGRLTDDGLVVDGNADAWVAGPTATQLLRGEVDLPKGKITRARVHASARGLYTLTIDGERVGDQELAPGWTDYRERIQYQTYDVTDQVDAGTNVLGAELARGWYAGRIASAAAGRYGTTTSLIAQLEVEYADGSTAVVGTDGTWRLAEGARTAADMVDGEDYDAGRAAGLAGWTEPGFDDAAWEPAEVIESATERLEPQQDQPVRVLEELGATRIESPDDGVYLYDLGQNMVGHVRARLTGAAGSTATVRFGEVLDQDGSLYTANLRGAKATDTYTFDDAGEGVLDPEFTFHGFRYVEITGVSEAPAQEDVVGVVLGTDTPEVSTFTTDSAMVNQLDQNIRWGRRGNFLSVPTDTPARDERLGWSGDINVFAQTAAYTADSRAFLRKWLTDLRDAQTDDGQYTGVAPVVPGAIDGDIGVAGWADAGVHVPFTLWQSYGDLEVVRENYDAMKRYVDFLHGDSVDDIRHRGGYLDWLNLDDPTDAPVVSTAYMARSTGELAEMARALGQDADAEHYQAKHDEIRSAYQAAFVADDGTVQSDSQTSYVLTIGFGLVPEDRADAVAERFVAALERSDWHLSTGFLGVDGLLPALTAIGRDDLAYRLLLHEDYPSWGYEISKGATTIWERWDSIRPDGSFQDVGMNSFNHYAYGAVGRWMYGTLAGVAPLEPGYRKVLVAPHVPGAGDDDAVDGVVADAGGVRQADYTLETPYGQVASAWDATGEGLRMTVTIPAGATGEIRVPATSADTVLESGEPAADAEGLTLDGMDDGAAVFTAGSGTYELEVTEG